MHEKRHFLVFEFNRNGGLDNAVKKGSVFSLSTYLTYLVLLGVKICISSSTHSGRRSPKPYGCRFVSTSIKVEFIQQRF